MKTNFRKWVKFPTTALVCGFVLALVFPSPSEQLKQASSPPKLGTFWLLSAQLEKRSSPPYPFDPYGGTLPVYELKDFPGQYVVADSPEEYQQLRASKEATLMTLTALETGEGGSTYSSLLFTNAPESLLFDTMSSASNGVLASWRDVRPSPVPDGLALGILIATNYPFELTRIEAEVVFEHPEALPDTEFEVGFFRSTNKFQFGMYEEPEYTASDVRGTLSKTLTDLGNGRFLLSVDLPSYGWGTNRIVTIRTVPNSNGTMAKMSLVACSDTVPGITAYASDNTTTNMVQVSLPKMRVWRRMVATTRAVSYETLATDMDIAWLPGYQLGSTTNLTLPMEWQTDDLNNWRAIVDTREGMRFFLTRPDPTE